MYDLLSVLNIRVYLFNYFSLYSLSLTGIYELDSIDNVAGDIENNERATGDSGDKTGAGAKDEIKEDNHFVDDSVTVPKSDVVNITINFNMK